MPPSIIPLPDAMSDLFAPAALSVSELNHLAKTLLEDQLSGLWVGGEVSNLVKAASGHYYFVLKDQRAQVRCTLFKHAARSLAALLREGAEVEVLGKITLYEARGEFQINVQEVRRKGLGQLFEAYERLKQRLQAEGLFDASRKRPLPEAPQCIGVVTSLAAAALRDVATTLRRRAPDVRVIVYPTAVQGAGSEFQVASALAAAAAHGQADVLIVCRGGGSMEDLWAFNEEAAVRAVAASPIPVVSGVGHETDFTLTDFAADLRAPTPTAAAELASPNRTEQLGKMQQLLGHLRHTLQRRCTDAAQRLDWHAAQLRHPRQKWQEQQAALLRSRHALAGHMQRHLLRKQEQLAYLAQLCRRSRPAPQAAARQVQAQAVQLNRHLAALLAHKQAQCQKQAGILEALSPQHTLARGYSVITDRAGKVVRDAGRLHSGQVLSLHFETGTAQAQVLPRRTRQQDLFD
nr:exodeoxyribonuclease VII large subunit [Eikenella longinqua]